MLSGLKSKTYKVMITYKASGMTEPLGTYNNKIQAFKAMDDFLVIYGDLGTLYLEED